MKTWVLRFLAPLVPLLAASCALHFPEGMVERQRVEVTMRSRVAPVAEPATVPVLVFADELHTGLILDLDWLERHGYVPPAGLRQGRWAAFSWGDETAYVQERWLSPAQVVHALFLPSDSVMEIIPFGWNVAEVCPQQRIYQGFAPESAGRSLAAFLNRCSVTGEDGRPVTIGPSSWGDGRLIRSPYSYYFPRICNIWTVDALNAAGFRMGGWRGLSADGVIRQAKKPANGFQQIWDPAWRMDDGAVP